MLVKEYFPVSVVVPTILEIYQNLLNVQFVEIKNDKTWHPGWYSLLPPAPLYRPFFLVRTLLTLLQDVQQFSVWEKDSKDESGFVGYCYLDLFPRESKYSHAAVWPLLSGYEKADGSRSYPLAAMVANLAKPTPDKPALMRHDGGSSCLR